MLELAVRREGFVGGAKAKLSEVAPWSLTLRIMIVSESSKAHTNRNQLDYRESLLDLAILARSAIENVNT